MDRALDKGGYGYKQMIELAQNMKNYGFIGWITCVFRLIPTQLDPSNMGHIRNDTIVVSLINFILTVDVNTNVILLL